MRKDKSRLIWKEVLYFLRRPLMHVVSSGSKGGVRLKEFASGNMGSTGLYPSWSFDGTNALRGICKYLCIEERPGRIIVLSLAQDRPDDVDGGNGTLSQVIAGACLPVSLQVR